jgi:hypothetical protein
MRRVYVPCLRRICRLRRVEEVPRKLRWTWCSSWLVLTMQRQWSNIVAAVAVLAVAVVVENSMSPRVRQELAAEAGSKTIHGGTR